MKFRTVPVPHIGKRHYITLFLGLDDHHFLFDVWRLVRLIFRYAQAIGEQQGLRLLGLGGRDYETTDYT